ncbi:DVU_1556 family methyltransferase [Desulfocurvibacter africanus]|uniref:DVU_1556 family methyltransferase n=1 Tax=Desulfocurvibacter africanus TaxID=873 RepID=UPI000687FA4C|nr:methyltransferase domain-containing protein [Desulfocurvibacter africanus]
MSEAMRHAGIHECGASRGGVDEPWERLALLRAGQLAPPSDHSGKLEAPTGFEGRMLRPGGLTLTARALEICALPPGARVLDAGCGAGDSLEFMCGMGLVPLGIDRSLDQLARCRARPELPVLRGQAQQLPFGDGCLDGILSECVLSLLPDPGQALGEWHRVLRPGGMLALSDLYALDRREPLHNAPCPASCLDGALPLENVLELVRAAGFEPLLVEDHTPLLKRFAAELVFAGIPLETFLGRTGDARSDQGCRCGHGSNARRPRAGYYLLVARKMESRHG